MTDYQRGQLEKAKSVISSDIVRVKDQLESAEGKLSYRETPQEVTNKTSEILDLSQRLQILENHLDTVNSVLAGDETYFNPSALTPQIKELEEKAQALQRRQWHLESLYRYVHALDCESLLR